MGPGTCSSSSGGNARVRRIAAGTGIITTVVGMPGLAGSPATAGPRPAPSATRAPSPLDPRRQPLYLADTRQPQDPACGGEHRHHHYRKPGTGVARFAGDGGSATAARLDSPSSIAVAADGALVIGDSGNYRVREVAATTGLISTVAGDGSPGFGGDGDLAIFAQLSNALAVALAPAGDLLISDAYNFRVRAVAAATGIITTVAGTGSYSDAGDSRAATSALLQYLPGSRSSSPATSSSRTTTIIASAAGSRRPPGSSPRSRGPASRGTRATVARRAAPSSQLPGRRRRRRPREPVHLRLLEPGHPAGRSRR
ncbi:MAG: hypothetical protein R2939_22060 [Kofleriaceae bacterium]